MRTALAIVLAIWVFVTLVLLVIWGLTSLAGVFEDHRMWWAALAALASALGVALAAIGACVLVLIRLYKEEKRDA